MGLCSSNNSNLKIYHGNDLLKKNSNASISSDSSSKLDSFLEQRNKNDISIITSSSKRNRRLSSSETLSLSNPKSNLESQRRNSLGRGTDLSWIGDIFSCKSMKEKKDLNFYKDFNSIAILGKGGFGCVYLVQYQLNGLYYAIKQIDKKELMMNNKNRHHHIYLEKNCLNACIHSNFIVHCFHTFQDKKFIYYVLEYLPGGELFDLCKQQQNHNHLHHQLGMDNESLQLYTMEIACAINDIHQQGYVYRDLKPENICLNAKGHLKIVDLGACNTLDPKGKCYTMMGTLEYYSPEQVESFLYNIQHPNEKKKGYIINDWWAFGCVIYELITSLPPFDENYDTKKKKDKKDILAYYQRILKGKISYQHEKFHQDLLLKNLLQRLLHRQLSKRLDTFEEIQSHPWFKSSSWKSIQQMKTLPFYIPILKKKGDCSNFQILGPKEIFYSQNKEIEIDQTLFKDF